MENADGIKHCLRRPDTSTPYKMTLCQIHPCGRLVKYQALAHVSLDIKHKTVEYGLVYLFNVTSTLYGLFNTEIWIISKLL